MIATYAILGLVVGLIAAVVAILIVGVVVGLATIARAARLEREQSLGRQLEQARVLTGGWRRR